jgi:thiamin-phosphate kinase
VLIGPRFGEDCAVIDIGNQYLVVKTDPVTFTAENIGWYAVHVNANDIATMGARPQWFQACLLFPPDTSEETVRQVFQQIGETSSSLGVSVTGGHTEITAAVQQPVVVGTMYGTADKDTLVTSDGAQPDDLVVMTKTAGLEGTSILVAEKAAELQSHLSQIEESLWQEALSLGQTFGISVVKEALLAAEHGATAMHDPTEGGIAMALYELASASGNGMRIELDTIPVLPVTQTICEYFHINPLGLISSGTLLLTIPPERWPELQERLYEEGIDASVIGTVCVGSGIAAFVDGKPAEFVYSETDELAKVL